MLLLLLLLLLVVVVVVVEVLLLLLLFAVLGLFNPAKPVPPADKLLNTDDSNYNLKN